MAAQANGWNVFLEAMCIVWHRYIQRHSPIASSAAACASLLVLIPCLYDFPAHIPSQHVGMHAHSQQVAGWPASVVEWVYVEMCSLGHLLGSFHTMGFCQASTGTPEPMEWMNSASEDTVLPLSQSEAHCTWEPFTHAGKEAAGVMCVRHCG
jgi:hypothetical protein